MRIDTDILDWFREQVDAAGGENYEPLQIAALLVERDLDRLADREVIEAVTSAARKRA